MKTLWKIVLCILTVSFLVCLAKAARAGTGKEAKISMSKRDREQRLAVLEQRVVTLEINLARQTDLLLKEHQLLSQAMEEQMEQMESRFHHHLLWGYGIMATVLVSLVIIRLFRKKDMPYFHDPWFGSMN